MDTLLQVVLGVGPYHWLALATLLIAIEMVMPTQYLLWPGVAAALVGLLAFLLDMSLTAEVAVFAVLSIGLTVMSDRLRPRHQADAGSSLNQRTDQLVGRPAVVAEEFVHGVGAVTVGDTRWSARSMDGSDFKAGALVVIASAESTLLVVREPASGPTR